MSEMNANKMILEDLRKKIASGEYSLGSRLPNERELADYYEVSRIPVREALKVLSDQGVLETKRGVGTFVRSTAKVMIAGKETSPFVKTEQVLLETIHLRKILESEAAAMAAKNATRSEIDQLENSLIYTIREIRKVKMGEENCFFEADEKFHMLVAKLSHNELFPNCLSAMQGIIAIHQYWSLKMTTPMDEFVSYHSAIFENILLHNEKGAREAMASHLNRVEELLKRNQAM